MKAVSTLLIGATAALIATTPIHAAPTQFAEWIGPDGGLWNAAANWDGAAVPSGSDWAATIEGASVTLTNDVTLGEGNLIDAELAHAQDYSFGARLVLTGGVVFRSTSSTLTLTGDSYLGTAETEWAAEDNLTVETNLINAGTFYQGAASTEDSFYSSSLFIEEGYQFTNTGNYHGSVVDDYGTTVFPRISGYGTFQNEGVFTKTGNGSLEILDLTAFINTGTVNIDEGTLLIATGSAGEKHSGQFILGEGATLEFATNTTWEAITFDEDSSVIGEGRLRISTMDGVDFEAGSTLDVAELLIDFDGQARFATGSSFTVETLGMEGGVLSIEDAASVTTADLRHEAIVEGGSFTVTGDAYLETVIFNGGDKAFNGQTTLFSDGYEEITTQSLSVNLLNWGTMTKTGEGTLLIGQGVTLVNHDQFIISEGTVLVAGSLEGDPVILAGGSLAQTVAEGTSLAALPVSKSGGDQTIAQFLEGKTSDSSVTTFTQHFANSVAGGTENFLSEQSRVSDVFSLTVSQGELEVFTLSLTVGVSPAGGESYFLGWLDGNNLWVNAVEGNTSGANTFFDGSYAEFLASRGEDPLTDYLGYWGWSDNQVWAVLNHQSEFAVISVAPIPEPGTWALVLTGVAAAAWMRRRRRS